MACFDFWTCSRPGPARSNRVICDGDVCVRRNSITEKQRPKRKRKLKLRISFCLAIAIAKRRKSKRQKLRNPRTANRRNGMPGMDSWKRWSFRSLQMAKL
nr:hypothetical protein Iba_chr11bCG1340 [Ipomoea batatas]